MLQIPYTFAEKGSNQVGLLRMARKKRQRALSRRKSSVSSHPPGFKIFRPLSWYESRCASPTEYISHLLQELGRLNLDIREIERYERGPHTKQVLSDLLHWLNGGSNSAVANLFNWQHLDLERMIQRINKDRKAKPRIEISATITKMNNLSVCWHPGGWRDSSFDWRSSGERRNLIGCRRWAEPPDYLWFVGDEEPTFQGRATNELMFIRGVGNLDPEPCEQYGFYAAYNGDVVDSILICALRSAYECLVTRLEESFDVVVIDAFDFVTRDESHDGDTRIGDWSTKRVTGWSLEDAAELRDRREQAKQAEKEQRERGELDAVSSTYGCSIENIIEALSQAYSSRPRNRATSYEKANRDAAKSLGTSGAKITAGGIRRIRELIERHRPEAIPVSLRNEPPTPSAPQVNQTFSNVIVLNLRRSDEPRAPSEHTVTPPPEATRPAQATERQTPKNVPPTAAERQTQLADELERTLVTLGCTLEGVVEALTRAYSRQTTEVSRRDDQANREAAKELRANGARIDLEGLRRLRRIIELCKPTLLPEALRMNNTRPTPDK
jgi:hypothetical protein